MEVTSKRKTHQSGSREARKCDRMGGGSVAEWLKAHDSKSCGQKCLGGSNPLASARIKSPILAVFLVRSIVNRASLEETTNLGDFISGSGNEKFGRL